MAWKNNIEEENAKFIPISTSKCEKEKKISQFIWCRQKKERRDEEFSMETESSFKLQSINAA